jgi:single-stranded-DNA-specific exonuclease
MRGYGISFKGIDFADDNGISHHCLRCGIKSLPILLQRNEISILSSVITIDLEKMPGSHSRFPKRDDCNYPYDELCGCGMDLN